MTTEQAPITEAPPVPEAEPAPTGPAVFRWRAAGADAERMIIIGATGSGKTTKAIELVSMAIAQGARVVWWDTKGLNDPQLPIVKAPALDSAQTLDTLLGEYGAITVQLDPAGDDDPQFDGTMRAAFELGNVLVVVDDAMGILQVRATKWLQRVITMGRARGVGFVSVVQRAHWIPRILLSEAEHIVAFELHDVDDLDVLMRTGNRSLERAGTLRRWEYLCYSRRDRHVVACEPIDL